MLSKREEPNQAELRRSMATPSHSDAYPGSRIPMWNSKCFMGEFGDVFVQDTDLEGGQTEKSIPEFCTVVEEALAKYSEALTLVAEDADKEIVRQVLSKLLRAASVAGELNACRGWVTQKFDRFLEARAKEVLELPEGDFLLWCGGWSGVNGGHAIMYLIDKTSSSELAFVTLNTGQGVGSHPGHPEGYPKQKRFTQMRLMTTIERITDPAWLYFLFKIQAGGHKDHTPEILYDVCLPALVGDTLARTCQAQSATEDPYAVPETLQRSGVCYYRCILTAMRYSLRRLGFQQQQVKQLLHTIRRAFVARVAEDLECLQQIVNDGSSSDRVSVQRGLYPSQLRLVRLSAEMLGYSAIKESKAGRLGLNVFEQVRAEVEYIDNLATALPVIGTGEDSNDWMAAVEGGASSSNLVDFLDASASSRSVSADLDSVAGSPVKDPPPLDSNFCSLPAKRSEIVDFEKLYFVLIDIQVLCKAIRKDEETRLNARLLQILSLIEHSFTVLLPIPVWGESSVWHAPNQESFSYLRDLLRWIALEYAAAGMSMPVPEASSIRALTNAAIMVAFFEVVRRGPTSGGDSHGDGIFAALLCESSLGFPTTTRAGEDFTDFTASLVMDTMALVVARNDVCKYIAAMKESTNDVAFGFVSYREWKLRNSSTDVKMTLSIVERLASEVGGFFAEPDDQLFKNVIGPRQTVDQITDVQRGLAWLMVPYAASGRHRGEPESSSWDDVVTTGKKHWDHFDSWLGLRDIITIFTFAISAPPTGARASKVFEHVSSEKVSGCDVSGASGLGTSFADTINFNYEDKPDFDEKFESAKIVQKLEGGWDSTVSSPSYRQSFADPKMWIEGRKSENGEEEKPRPISEDDILHTPNLMDFDAAISQEDAEVLFSYLTVPYLRIPLALEFFAKDRVGALFDERLQMLLWHCLFCPGNWGWASNDNVIDSVPCQPELLYTDRGYFVAELERSPGISLSAIMRILSDGIRLAVGNFESSFVPVLLYLVRLAVRVLLFIRSIEPARASEIAALESFDVKMAQWLDSSMQILRKWQSEAMEENRKDAECSFQAHIALLVWTCVVHPSEGAQFDETMATRMLASVAFVNTWNVLGESAAGKKEGEEDGKSIDDKLRDLSPSAAGSVFALGVSDQEMFWLVQHRRFFLQDFMKNAQPSTLQGILEVAIRTTTGESELQWVTSDSGVEGGAQWVGDSQEALLGYRDGKSFFVNIQTCAVTYKSSKLKPVPDLIARHPDFFNFYQGAVPHCATVSNLSSRQEVFVPKGQKLIAFWQPTESRLDFPGCPVVPGADTGKPLVIETDHPYTEGSTMSDRVKFGEETTWIELRFDPRCDSKGFYDTLTLTWKERGKWIEKQYHGYEDNMFPQKLIINSNSFSYNWYVLGADEGKWGFRMTVVSGKSTAGMAMEFNGISYGGSADREYRYGDPSPADIPWLGSVLDPVLHSELAEPVKNNPGVVKWKKFGESKLKANELLYLLPSTPNEEATQDTVALLSISGERKMGKQFWRLLRVSRRLQTVDVFVVDLLGRRAFPRQVYSSDSRLSLCASYPSVQNEKKVMHPPRSIVRFSEGDFLGIPIGGNDVLIYDKTGEDTIGVRLFVPPRSLSGVLPGALVEGFDFWENQTSGQLEGKRKQLTLMDEKGQERPFVDPFFNYTLQVRPNESSCSSAVVRIDEDPASLTTSARRLVNLSNFEPGSAAAEIVRLLTQIDALSHILAWTDSLSDAEEAHALAASDLIPSLVELPRLRIRFTVSVAEGKTTLFVVDRGSTFVLPDRSKVNPELISGLPRCLVLSDSSEALEILVPNYPLARPKVSCAPFTTWCNPEPNDVQWLSACDSRYYLYSVHPSDAFVRFKSVGATLYWAFLKFMDRQYEVAFKTIESCSTDMPLSYSEQTILGMFCKGNDDRHPDAHACRLKLRLSLLHCPVGRWPLVADEGTNPNFAGEYKAYLTKRGHVSMACRLSYLEEVRVIKNVANTRTGSTLDSVVLTRANYLDKMIVGEDRKMLIPHEAVSFECPHPYKDHTTCYHSKSFLLPHSRAIRIDFDKRSKLEEYTAELKFGDSEMMWAEIPEYGCPTSWELGVYEISGIESSAWNKSILIRGNSFSACFDARGSFDEEPLWGYRFTCRPARQDELGDDLFTEADSNEFEAAADPQNDGGSSWFRILSEKLEEATSSRVGGEMYKELQTCDPAWFGSVAIDQDLIEPQLEGAGMLAALDKMWSADLSGKQGGGYPVLMNILAGHTAVSIGGSTRSGRTLVEMLTRLSQQLNNIGANEALFILVALVGLPESAFAATDGFSSCANYNNPVLGDNPTCYCNGGESGLRYADPDTQLHVGTHLQIVGDLICKAVDSEEARMLKSRPDIRQRRTVNLPVGPENAESTSVVRISNYAQALYTCSPVELGPAIFTSEDCAAFMNQPLSRHIDFSEFVSEQDISREVPSSIPYDLSGHPDAETSNAIETLKRIADDCDYYAGQENSKTAAVTVGITPELMQEYQDAQDADGGPGSVSPSFADAALEQLSVLKDKLQQGLLADSERLIAATAHVISAANTVPAEGGDGRERLEFQFLQRARLQARISLPHLVASLVSTEVRRDIQTLNPFIDDDALDALLKATVGIVLSANRISQLRRTIGCVDDVMKAITRQIDARKLQKEISGLEGNLLSKRHYASGSEDALELDPRFMLFEYMTTFILRKAQVYLVQTFMERAVKGGSNAYGDESNSMVHQMIMGAGKTTVIGPLLALMLADGKSLVTQVVPNALLVMSRNVMWAAFCNVIVKPVFTLTFDRSWPNSTSVYSSMYEKMVLARQSGGIVVTTPSAIKSIVNKYIELLNSLSESPIDRLLLQAAKTNSEMGKRATIRLAELQNNSDTADAIARIMNLWSNREKGTLLLDEVDMLLHPLRSELNFPIGEKFPLTPSGLRWDLPMHLLDVILEAARAAIAENGSSSCTDALMKEMCDIIVTGLSDQRLQRVPHLVLLDATFYEEMLRSLLVRRSLSWFKAHHIFESCADTVPEASQLEEYVTRGNLASEEVVSAVSALPGDVIQALNFAYDWTCSYAPHILAKVDRVSFGLLQPADEELLKGKEQPASRKLLGIPFVGKGVPSAAAEFAQPDVLIGNTILAYRYEGLRITDLKQTVRLLKEAMAMEAGPKNVRPAYLLFESWVTSACNKQGITSRPVMDLDLFQISDRKQMAALFELVRMESEVIHHYLREIVFPRTMQQQRIKISSSGQELGSDILFGRRLGFSGTPSSLLPVELVPCHFEQGSEGKIIRMLTDASVTKEASISKDLAEPGAPDWTVQGVLDAIAQSTDPPFRALIDTGALITGYSNEEVARYLVDTGLQHLQGCVFLDHRDVKMIYLRGAARSIPLADCGIGRGERFTFYDQYHTTGMDIKQSLSAAALLTIGKDMIFRDYAQGAFRMRGIGQGQTIHLFIVPEIKKLIAKTLPRMTGNVEDDVAAWLQLNGIKMEKMQFLQLCSQNMQTVWRKVALDMLLASSGVMGVNVVEDIEGERLGDNPGTGMKRFCDDGKLRTCIGALRDVVNFDVPRCIPSLEPYSVTLQNMVDAQRSLVKTEAQERVISVVMQQVDDALQSSATRESAGAKKGLNSEMTREKEREQEQQKQKQQQQQQESMFDRDKGLPSRWAIELLGSSPKDGDLPFYNLSQFSPRPFEFSFKVDGAKEPTIFPSVAPISFPDAVLQSMNFAPLERVDATKPLRLKNVCLLMDWYPDAASPEHFTVVITLGEAETLRRLIQARKRGGDESTISNALPEQVAVAVVLSSSNTVIDATVNYPGFINSDTSELAAEFLSVKFWNNDMYFKQQDITTLLSAIEANSTDARRAFFEAAIVARRRSRKSWAGTPLRSIFSFEVAEQYIDTLDLLQQLQERVQWNGIDVWELCDQADFDGNGFLSQQELMDVLDSLQLSGVAPIRLQRLMELMDVSGDNAVNYSEFSTLIGADATVDSQLQGISQWSSGTGEAQDSAARQEQARLAREARLEEQTGFQEEWAVKRSERAKMEQKRREENRADERRAEKLRAQERVEQTKSEAEEQSRARKAVKQTRSDAGARRARRRRLTLASAVGDAVELAARGNMDAALKAWCGTGEIDASSFSQVYGKAQRGGDYELLVHEAFDRYCVTLRVQEIMTDSPDMYRVEMLGRGEPSEVSDEWTQLFPARRGPQVVMEGWLKKRGPTVDFSWENRWCVLNPTSLIVYVDRSCHEKKSDVDIFSNSNALPFKKSNAPGEAVKHKSERPCGFVLDYDPSAGKNRRLFYFDAEDADGLNSWVSSILQAANEAPAPPSAGTSSPRGGVVPKLEASAEPDSGRGAQSFESSHPFTEGDEEEFDVTFPLDVQKIQIEFDKRSCGDEFAFSSLIFSWKDMELGCPRTKAFWDVDPFVKFTIVSNEFNIWWQVIDANASDAWGWKFTATPK